MNTVVIGIGNDEIYGASSSRIVDGINNFSVSKGSCGTRSGVRYNAYNVSSLIFDLQMYVVEGCDQYSEMTKIINNLSDTHVDKRYGLRFLFDTDNVLRDYCNIIAVEHFIKNEKDAILSIESYIEQVRKRGHESGVELQKRVIREALGIVNDSLY